MKFLTKIASLAAGVVAAAGLNMAAHAALVISSPDLSTVLDFDNPISLDNDDMTSGAFVDVGTFSVAPKVWGSEGFVDVRFSSGFKAGIINMMVSFDVDGDVYTYQVTDGAGRQILDYFTLAVKPGATVMTTITGTVFEDPGQDANYNMIISTAEIPAPAAGLLLLTGLAGLAGARKRKQA